VELETFAPTPCGNLEMRWDERTYVMGIVNVNPDSFSGDGLRGDVDTAVTQAKRFVAEGANIVRVHDVKEMMRVCRMSDAIVRRR
jgi:dihydropteroate synthase